MWTIEARYGTMGSSRELRAAILLFRQSVPGRAAQWTCICFSAFQRYFVRPRFLLSLAQFHFFQVFCFFLLLVLVCATGSRKWTMCDVIKRE